MTDDLIANIRRVTNNTISADPLINPDKAEVGSVQKKTAEADLNEAYGTDPYGFAQLADRHADLHSEKDAPKPERIIKDPNRPIELAGTNNHNYKSFLAQWRSRRHLIHPKQPDMKTEMKGIPPMQTYTCTVTLPTLGLMLNILSNYYHSKYFLESYIQHCTKIIIKIGELIA